MNNKLEKFYWKYFNKYPRLFRFLWKIYFHRVSLLPIATHVDFSPISFDIVGVPPMSPPSGKLFWLDYVYRSFDELIFANEFKELAEKAGLTYVYDLEREETLKFFYNMVGGNIKNEMMFDLLKEKLIMLSNMRKL
jgi:hypothetical protein